MAAAAAVEKFVRRFAIGEEVSCDLDALVNTRLLVQANSGAGKSWALRRLLEQTHGQVQHLVIDPEGEFASLREKFDYVLAARTGGDTAADPRTAKLLAERLLELGTSAILDIYELKPHERVRFVRLFLEALVDAPKQLWHPALIVVDEAHVYCPEQGDAESADAVKGLCTRGRKRGFCAVLATQRLSKLHKDAAAECNNKLIGRSSLDVDMKRAADDLGLTDKPSRLLLRELDNGEFFAFGPALSRQVTKVRVGPVITTHPKAGSHLAAVIPPPTAKVLSVLAKLADLPAEAEAREKTVEDLKRDNATLRRQLTEAQKAQPTPEPQRIEVPVLSAEDISAIHGLIGELRGVGDKLVSGGDALMQTLNSFRARQEAPPTAPTRQTPQAPRRAEPTGSSGRPSGARTARPAAASGDLDGAQQKILDVVAMLGVRGITPARDTVARWMPPKGIHPNGGRYGSNLARLREDGYLDGFELTAKGEAAARALDTAFAAAKAVLDGAQCLIVDTLDNDKRTRFTRETLADVLGIHPNGGRYGSNLARLRVMGLIPERGSIYLTQATYL